VLATAYLIGICNEANAALVGDVGDGPLKKHREPIPETDEHQYVNEEPGEPGQQAVKPRPTQIGNSRAAAEAWLAPDATIR
jgi:hypothetical protein